MVKKIIRLVLNWNEVDSSPILPFFIRSTLGTDFLRIFLSLERESQPLFNIRGEMCQCQIPVMNQSVPFGGGPVAGRAPIGGQIAYVEKGGNIIEDALHEVGHNMGLDKTYHTPDPMTPMSYHKDSDGSNFTSEQLRKMWSSTQNIGSNSARMSDEFPRIAEHQWGLSTDKRPFNMAPSQRAIIPKPLK